MRWMTPKAPEAGDVRFVRRFCWWPTQADDGKTYWLCFVLVVEAWFVRKRGQNLGPGRPHAFGVYGDWDRFAVIGDSKVIRPSEAGDYFVRIKKVQEDLDRTNRERGLQPPKPWPRPDRPPPKKG